MDSRKKQEEQRPAQIPPISDARLPRALADRDPENALP